MVQKSISTNDGRISSETDRALTQGVDGIVDEIAGWLYSLASMLVGEGEESARLVETAVTNTEVSACQDPEQARKSSRRALCEAALKMLADRNPGSMAAPAGLKPAGTCIDDDDLEAAEIAREDFERMIAGDDRERVREWLAGLPAAVRSIFVLRAVAGLSAAETDAVSAAMKPEADLTQEQLEKLRQALGRARLPEAARHLRRFLLLAPDDPDAAAVRKLLEGRP